MIHGCVFTLPSVGGSWTYMLLMAERMQLKYFNKF